MRPLGQKPTWRAASGLIRFRAALGVGIRLAGPTHKISNWGINAPAHTALPAFGGPPMLKNRDIRPRRPGKGQGRRGHANRGTSLED